MQTKVKRSSLLTCQTSVHKMKKKQTNIDFFKEYTTLKNPAALGGVTKFFHQLKSKYKHVKLDQVKDWLQSQDVYTLHAPRIKKIKRNRVFASSIDDNWQMDLCDMRSISRENNGIQYILTVIDVFSKFAWIRLLKNKKSATVLEAIKSIMEKRKPKRVQTDEGLEFFNKDCKDFMTKHNIKLYFTRSEMKAAIIERFNRTLKEKIWRHFTLNKTNKYIDVIDDLVFSYNKSYHRSIKMTPSEVKTSNSDQVFLNLYGFDKRLDSNVSKSEKKFNIGDTVRISKYKPLFEKGYTNNWSKEIFVINKVFYDKVISYQIKDINDEIILGRFYQNELLKVKFDYKKDISTDSFDIEILKTKIVKNKKLYFVHWKNYPSSLDSWIEEKDLI